VHDWNCGGINRIQNGGGVIAPMAGQVAWYNGGGSYFIQSLPGAKLQPDTTYQLTFDAYTTAASSDPRIIHAGLMFGNNNNPLDDLTVDIWDSSGIQVFIDNVRVTNYPRNRSMQPKVSNGTFDFSAIDFNTAEAGIDGFAGVAGVINAAVVSPLSGQCAFLNSAVGFVQTFPGIKLKPNRNYRITFDSYSMPNWDLRTIKVGLCHARYFSDDSR